jgi:hypothetical protein
MPLLRLWVIRTLKVLLPVCVYVRVRSWGAGV